MDNKLREEIKESIKEIQGTLLKLHPENKDKIKTAQVLHQHELIKFALSNDLSEKMYLATINNASLLAIAFMSAVGMKVNDEKEYTKNAINDFKDLVIECLKMIDSIEAHSCEHCEKDHA